MQRHNYVLQAIWAPQRLSTQVNPYTNFLISTRESIPILVAANRPRLTISLATSFRVKFGLREIQLRDDTITHQTCSIHHHIGTFAVVARQFRGRIEGACPNLQRREHRSVDLFMLEGY